jgi:transcriptional regulator with XRE-family HTH domain
MTARERDKATGARLRSYRVEAGKTQAEVAEAMGSTPSAISHLELGEYSPSMDHIERYIRALGFDGIDWQPVPRDVAFTKGVPGVVRRTPRRRNSRRRNSPG